MMDVFTLFRAQENWAIRGIAMEVVDRLRALGAVENAPGYEDYGRVYFNHEVLKSLADAMVLEAGIELRLHTLGVSPIMEGDTIKGIITESKSGREAFPAKVVVDVSGDADIAYRAGAEFLYGREQDGRVQPMTVNFMAHGVDVQALRAYMRKYPEDRRFSRIVKQAKDTGDFPNVKDHVALHRITDSGIVTGINFTRVLGKNPTRAEDLTYAEIEARKQVWLLRDFMRKYMPGFDRCDVAAMATQINRRESRRVIGQYIFSDDDMLKGARFSDAIAKHPCFIDLHNPSGGDSRVIFPRQGEITEIPYRCLVPKRVDGLLMAGKCVSATHVAEAGLRYLVCSFATGEAAGTAAAQAVRTGVPPRQVDVPVLQQTLRTRGAIC